MTTSSDLKILQRRQAEIANELSDKRKALTETSKVVQELEHKLKTIHSQTKKLIDASKSPIVSEHAQLRYVERVLGIDLEEVKQKIMDSLNKDHLKQFKSGRFPLGDGKHMVVVRDRTVVTVEPK